MSLRTLLRRREGDEGMAMIVLVSCLLVSGALVVAVLGVLTSELRPTSYQRTSVRTISAAESGLHAGLATIRAAVSVRPVIGKGGDPTLLPCADDDPLDGEVGGGSTARYTVRIRYYATDPRGRDASWLTDNAMACATGRGPATMPAYALLEATGSIPGEDTVTSADRSQSVVYVFNSTDVGVLGGLVRTGGYSTAADKCWTAQVPPSAGTSLTLQACDDSDPRQLFSYRSDYSLALASTQTSASPPEGGMCVSADPVGATSSADAAGSRPLSPTGQVVRPVAGPLDASAVELDGASTWFATTSPTTLTGSTTVAAWFRTTTPGGVLVELGDNGSPAASTTVDRQLRLTATGALAFGTSSATGVVTVTSPGTYADGVWHFAVGSVGASGVKLYVDGVRVATSVATTAGTVRTGWWHVGGGLLGTAGWPAASGSGFLAGGLAHAGVWSAQLSDYQVSSIAAQSTSAALQSSALGSSPSSYWPLGGSTSNQVLTLQDCDARPHQSWSYNDSGRFQLERLDGTALADQCIDAPDQLGATLVVVPCGSSREWTPEATAGAGAAGETTSQLVNYAEYGRCLDVTNWQLSWQWLIDYPCKQDPVHGPGANQRWTYDAVSGRIITQFDTGYCLTAPAANGGYVLTTPCSGTSSQRWTVNRDTGVRATSYTIVDSAGRCLSLGPPGASSGGLSQWSSITSETCDGGFEQKWNAPAALAGTRLVGQRETTGGR